MKAQAATATAVGIIGLAMVLGGCMAPPSLGPGEADFGNAVRHNIEAQVVNPDPMPQEGSAPYSGVRAGLGMTRYKTDNVKEPHSLRTSTILQSSGGGGGQ